MVARQAHNLKVAGSNPAPVTNEDPELQPKCSGPWKPGLLVTGSVEVALQYVPAPDDDFNLSLLPVGLCDLPGTPAHDLCCNRFEVGISTIAEVRRRISFWNAIRGRRQINFVVGETPEVDVDRAAENSIL